MALRPWRPAELVFGWLLGCVLLTAEVWLFVHVPFRIPVSQLVEPTAAFIFLFTLCLPALHWSWNYMIRSRGDLRPFYGVAGVFGLLGTILLLHYGARLGLIPEEKLRSYIPLMFVAALVFSVGGYLLSKDRFKEKFPDR